jgi:hypothetical protein
MNTIKDKINIISGIALLAIAGITTLTYVADKNFSTASLISIYVMIPLFLIWFGTRRNGCGSCNQVYEDQSQHTQ